LKDYTTTLVILLLLPEEMDVHSKYLVYHIYGFFAQGMLIWCMVNENGKLLLVLEWV
jgi:hypothetical protein